MRRIAPQSLFFDLGKLIASIFWLIIAAVPVSLAASTPAETGLWRTEDGVSVVEIAACGDSLCGHLVSFPHVPGDPALNAELCNLQILGGFKRDRPGRWVDGWVAALKEDKVYQAAIRAVTPDRLDVRAYEGSERYGETVVWSRHAGAVDRCTPRR